MRNELLRTNWSRECTLTVHIKLNALSQLSMWTTGISWPLVLEDGQQKYATNTATIRTPRRNRKNSVFWKDTPLLISPLALAVFGGSVKWRGVLKFKEIPAAAYLRLESVFYWNVQHRNIWQTRKRLRANGKPILWFCLSNSYYDATP